MTEAEWLTGVEFEPMLEQLKGRASPRKLRLSGVACSRLIPFVMQNPERARVLKVVEDTAEDVLGEVGASLARPVRPESGTPQWEADFVWRLTEEDTWEAARLCADGLMRSTGFDDGFVCDLIREVFPNPFWQIEAIPEKLPPEATALAQEMYRSQCFDRMIMLGGYIRRADWSQAVLLDHCFAFRPHVRGCWVLDLLLGRS